MYSIEDREYWDRKARDMAEKPRPPIDKAHHLRRIAINSDTSPTMQTLRAEARRKIDVIERWAQAAEDAEWTREATITRRADWNRAINDPQYRAGNSILTGKVEMALGFTHRGLVTAVKRHKLR